MFRAHPELLAVRDTALLPLCQCLVSLLGQFVAASVTKGSTPSSALGVLTNFGFGSVRVCSVLMAKIQVSKARPGPPAEVTQQKRRLVDAALGGLSYRYQGILITRMRWFPRTSRSSFSS
jgi:hypothetical protein